MNKKLEQAIALIEGVMADIKHSEIAEKNMANQMFCRQLKAAVENIETSMTWKQLFASDYVIYDKANDHVIQFDNGEIVLYEDKEEAIGDCMGNEVVIPCTTLPQHWQYKLMVQINQD
jgi:hypothetical protein